MQIFKTLFSSIKLAMIMLALYAVIIALATFIESAYSPAIARSLVYDRLYFELLNAYIFILLVVSIFVYKPYKHGKLGLSVLHIGLAVCILGAGVTRFFGFEGMMHIRNGQSSSAITTSDKYFILRAIDENGTMYEGSARANINPLYSHFDKDIVLKRIGRLPMNEIEDGTLAGASKDAKGAATSALKRAIEDTDSKDISPATRTVRVEALSIAFIGDKKYQKESYIGKIKLSYKGLSEDIELGMNAMSKSNTSLRLGDLDIATYWDSIEKKLPFSIYLKEFQLERYAGSNSPSSYASEVIVQRDGKDVEDFRIYMNHVLDFDGYRFFQSSYDMDEQGTILSVNNDPGKWPTYIGYALLIIGSIWLVFEKGGRMHQLLRVLQSQRIISTAFSLLAIGALASLLSMPLYASEASPPPVTKSEKGSTARIDEGKPRDKDLVKEDAKSRDTKVNKAPTTDAHNDANALMREIEEAGEMVSKMSSVELFNKYKSNSAPFANSFAHLLVQNFAGRIEPIDTLSYNLAYKIVGRSSFKGLDANQLSLGIMFFPELFREMKLLKTSTKELRRVLGTPLDERYVSFNDVFTHDKKSNAIVYKLYNYVQAANVKSPAKRDEFDKDLIKFDERVNIFYMVSTGQMLRIFPQGANSKWDNIQEILRNAEAGPSFNIILQGLFAGIVKGVAMGNYDLAYRATTIISRYQQSRGGASLPNKRVIDAEIFLNHYNLFKYLILPYILLGLLMFGYTIYVIFASKSVDRRVTLPMYIVVYALLAVHLVALGLRWYISGHSPWSNAYESMLYISFVSAFVGSVIFARSLLATSTALFLAGISLFVANLGFMDPQVSQLVPVLKSYWLNIHVSIIISSYGFFGLNFFLGILTLILFALRSQSRDGKILPTIKSLSAINEMAMILGLLLLLIGNFLGGVWANESWGRYWGWDPKETWTLVSIGVYAIVLHLRFIKGIKNQTFVFAVNSMLAFYTILMTYFGVNYFLTGMHSYAAGEAMPVPKFVYVFVLLMVVLIALAYRFRDMKKVYKAS